MSRGCHKTIWPTITLYNETLEHRARILLMHMMYDYSCSKSSLRSNTTPIQDSSLFNVIAAETSLCSPTWILPTPLSRSLRRCSSTHNTSSSASRTCEPASSSSHTAVTLVAHQKLPVVVTYSVFTATLNRHDERACIMLTGAPHANQLKAFQVGVPPQLHPLNHRGLLKAVQRLLIQFEAVDLWANGQLYGWPPCHEYC